MTDTRPADPRLHPMHRALVAALMDLEPGHARLALAAVVGKHEPATWQPQRMFITCSECCCLAWPPPEEPSAMWSEVVYPCATIQCVAHALGLPVDELTILEWPPPGADLPPDLIQLRYNPEAPMSEPVSTGPIVTDQLGFQHRDGEPLTLEQAVFQALGAASASWETLEGAGVFDSERAKSAGERLIAAIRSGTLAGQLPTGREVPAGWVIVEQWGVRDQHGEVYRVKDSTRERAIEELLSLREGVPGDPERTPEPDAQLVCRLKVTRGNDGPLFTGRTHWTSWVKIDHPATTEEKSHEPAREG